MTFFHLSSTFFHVPREFFSFTAIAFTILTLLTIRIRQFDTFTFFISTFHFVTSCFIENTESVNCVFLFLFLDPCACVPPEAQSRINTADSEPESRTSARQQSGDDQARQDRQPFGQPKLLKTRESSAVMNESKTARTERKQSFQIGLSPVSRSFTRRFQRA